MMKKKVPCDGKKQSLRQKVTSVVETIKMMKKKKHYLFQMMIMQLQFEICKNENKLFMRKRNISFFEMMKKKGILFVADDGKAT